MNDAVRRDIKGYVLILGDKSKPQFRNKKMLGFIPLSQRTIAGVNLISAVQRKGTQGADQDAGSCRMLIMDDINAVAKGCNTIGIGKNAFRRNGAEQAFSFHAGASLFVGQFLLRQLLCQTDHLSVIGAFRGGTEIIVQLGGSSAQITTAAMMAFLDFLIKISRLSAM